MSDLAVEIVQSPSGELDLASTSEFAKRQVTVVLPYDQATSEFSGRAVVAFYKSNGVDAIGGTVYPDGDVVAQFNIPPLFVSIGNFGGLSVSPEQIKEKLLELESPNKLPIAAIEGLETLVNDYFDVPSIVDTSEATTIEIDLEETNQPKDYLIVNFDSNAAAVNIDLTGVIPANKGQVIKVLTQIGSGVTAGTIRIRRNTGSPVNLTNLHKVVHGWEQPEFYIEATSEGIRITRNGENDYVEGDSFAAIQGKVFTKTRTVRIAGIEYVYNSAVTASSSSGDDPTADDEYDLTGGQIVAELVDQAGVFRVFTARKTLAVATTNNQTLRSGKPWNAVAGHSLSLEASPTANERIVIYRLEQDWATSNVTLDAGSGRTVGKDQATAAQTFTLDTNVDYVVLTWQSAESNWWVEIPALPVPTTHQLPQPADLASFKALNTSVFTQASYGGSSWNFVTGDYTALLALHPANVAGICVKADAVDISTGAWIREYEILDPAYFGSMADANHNAMLSAALDVASYLSTPLDGMGRTYVLTASISKTGKTINFSNAILDTSTMPNLAPSYDRVIELFGTQASSVALTADLLSEGTVINVASTATFAAEDYVWLESTTVWDSATGVNYGQMAQVKTIDSGTQMTLYVGVHYDFLISASASISKLSLLQSPKFRDLKIIGKQADSQVGIYVDKALNPMIQECSIENIDYCAIIFSRCWMPYARRNNLNKIRKAGLAYGIAVANGCYGAELASNIGYDMRHGITIGDNGGINVHVYAHHNKFYSCKDAGLDAHAAADFIDFSHNLVECADIASGASDGIICQGGNFKAAHNTVKGAKRHGIFYQHSSTMAVVPDVDISENLVVGHTSNSAGSGIYANPKFVNTLKIFENTIKRFPIHVQIYPTLAGSNIKSVNIANNMSGGAASTYPLIIRTATGTVIGKVLAQGNDFRSLGVETCYFFGGDANSIGRVILRGNFITNEASSGTRRCIRAINVNRLRLGGNDLEVNGTEVAASSGVYTLLSGVTSVEYLQIGATA